MQALHDIKASQQPAFLTFTPWRWKRAPQWTPPPLRTT